MVITCSMSSEFFLKVQLVFQLRRHQEQALVAPLVLLPQQQAVVVPASPQDHGRSEGSGHRQSDQGSRARASVSSPRTPEDRYRLITLEIKSLTRKAAPHPPQRGGAPVPDQQAEHAVIAEVEHAAGILHPQRLPGGIPAARSSASRIITTHSPVTSPVSGRWLSRIMVTSRAG